MEIYYNILSEKPVCNMSSISHLSRIYIHFALHSTDIGGKAASKTRVTPVSGLKQSLQKSFWSYCCPNQWAALWDKRGKAPKNFVFQLQSSNSIILLSGVHQWIDIYISYEVITAINLVFVGQSSLSWCWRPLFHWLSWYLLSSPTLFLPNHFLAQIQKLWLPTPLPFPWSSLILDSHFLPFSPMPLQT